MIPLDTLLLFTITTFVIVLAPGPAAIAVTAEAVSNGFNRSFWLILGVATANVIFFILSATGIAALLIASTTLFTALKWVGVAYLLYLGLRAIFSVGGPLRMTDNGSSRYSTHTTFLRGFVLELANPKALLYFSALLPQFVNPGEPVAPQLFTYCLITFCLDLIGYTIYASLGARSAAFKEKPQVARVINRIAGGLLIFTAIRMASFER